MEGVTGLIIVLFVVTIFSSLGGKPSQPQNFNVEQPQKVYYSSVSVDKVPATSFAVVDPEEAKIAIRNYIAKYRDQDEASSITNNILIYSEKYDVNPKLVAALMSRESRFNPKAVSSSGALGLGQLLPSTCTSLGVNDGFDIEQNVNGTVRYMKYLLDRFQGNQEQVAFAVAGYLEGPNAVSRNQGFSSHSKSYVEDIVTIYNKM